MSMTEKLRLLKPHIRKVKGVWCVYFSNTPGAKNWEAWDYCSVLQGWSEPHYYHAETMPVGQRGEL